MILQGLAIGVVLYTGAVFGAATAVFEMPGDKDAALIADYLA